MLCETRKYFTSKVVATTFCYQVELGGGESSADTGPLPWASWVQIIYALTVDTNGSSFRLTILQIADRTNVNLNQRERGHAADMYLSWHEMVTICSLNRHFSQKHRTEKLVARKASIRGNVELLRQSLTFQDTHVRRCFSS